MYAAPAPECGVDFQSRRSGGDAPRICKQRPCRKPDLVRMEPFEVAVVNVQPPSASLTRGVWDAHGRLHVHGVALCDWWCEKTRSEQRAWLRDRGRAVERSSGGLYRYFPDAL